MSPQWPPWPQTGPEEQAALQDVLASGLWGGTDAPAVLEFERAWSDYLGVRETKACSNGTVSLVIALRVLGIGSGDEVIVPAYTFVGTATAVLEVCALPVFADIDPETHCIDPDHVATLITPRTKAVIPVHLAGQPADLDRLGALCRQHDLALIEDAAQAHGAEWKGRKVGSVGEFGSWSFQSTKNLASGEGGALTTNSPELAELADSFRNCGRVRGGGGHEHHRLGENYRITAFQAALLLAGLRRLPDQFRRREAAAAVLNRQLAEIPGIRPVLRDPQATAHAYHTYQFGYEPAAGEGGSRAEFVAALNREGIPAGTGYPVPVYRQPVFAQLAFDRQATGWSSSRPGTNYPSLHLPAAERASATTITLPHRLLLADPDDMSEIAAAVERAKASVQA